MTTGPFEAKNLHMQACLQERGAIGARLISAEQIGKASFRLKLQTIDDRRVVVTFKTDVEITVVSNMEIKYPDGKPREPASSSDTITP